MKKSIKYVFVIILAVCMILLCACAEPPTMPKGDFDKVLNRKLPALSADSDGVFTVLQLTDTHFQGSGGKKDKKTLDGIEKLVDSGDYDLVVITGDMVDGYNNNSKFNKLNAYTEIADLFESKNQYWAYTAGNNDGEYCGGNEDGFAFLADYEHCLISDVGVGGVGNYTIDVTYGGETVHTVFFIDSRMRDDKGVMEAIDESQTDWYEGLANDLKNKGIYTSAFMHVPFLEFAEAFKDGQIIDSYNNHASTLEINVNKDSSKMYQVMKEIGNNGIIGTGHTHGSDYLRYYNDMYWLQVRSCGYTQWNDNLSRGGAVIKINTLSSNIKDMYSVTNINF